MTLFLNHGWMADSVQQVCRAHIIPTTLVIAQTYQENLGDSVQNAWDNFIQSGQVWALIIGFFLGYVFRAITSY